MPSRDSIRERESLIGELLFFGGVAGAIAAPIKLLVFHIFVWLGLAQPFYMQMTAFLTHGHYVTKGFSEFLFGEFGDMCIGALFGAIAGLVLRHSQPKYHWWIGVGLGFGIWFASLAFGNITKILKDTQTDQWSLFAHLLSMIVFGLLIILASRIWRPLRLRVMPDAETEATSD